MTRLVIISFQILILLFLVLFIINKSFTISFEINDFIYSLSSSYVFAFLLFLFVLIFFIQTVYFKTISRINRYQTNNLLRKQKKGYEYFTKGMVALANKDYKNASLLSLKLNKFLSDDKSLFMLLRSEVYKKTKKFDQLKITYDEMINNQTTRELGEIGLMEYYLSLQDFHHAFLYAERLFSKNPNIEKLYSNLLQIIAKTNNWSQLLQISKRAYDNKIISKKIYHEHRSISLFEIAKIKHSSNTNEAINLLKEAIKLRNFFTPYVKFLADMYIRNKNIIDLKKLITLSWQENPNSELRKFIIHISNIVDLDVVKFVSNFKKNKKDNQNQMLQVHAYIAVKQWHEARENVKNIMTANPSKEICEFMSMIELGENNDIVKSNSWKIRAENADLENCWICAISSQPQKEWSSVSNSGYFNSLEWRQIPMLYHQQLEKINNAN